MAKNDNAIGPKIVIEGETEFRRSITDINKTMSVLDSEMRKVSAQFDGNALYGCPHCETG